MVPASVLYPPTMRAAPLILLLATAVDAHASDHLGARRCKACHQTQYAQWKATAHARAAHSLSVAERRDPKCAACHSTSAADGLEGVQCESCHGAGEHYWPEYVMRDVGLARAVGLTSGKERVTCSRCHTADSPRLRVFDFAAALKKVVHR